MTEIRPSYYAAGDNSLEFELIGENFDLLPSDTVGVQMHSNDDPLANRYEPVDVNLMHIVERSSTRILVRAYRHWEHIQCSIGALLSNDRSVVYWVNETRPLP